VEGGLKILFISSFTAMLLLLFGIEYVSGWAFLSLMRPIYLFLLRRLWPLRDQRKESSG
jgi:hypothetical protein